MQLGEVLVSQRAACLSVRRSLCAGSGMSPKALLPGSCQWCPSGRSEPCTGRSSSEARLVALSAAVPSEELRWGGASCALLAREP